jgi:hypothetical protein
MILIGINEAIDDHKNIVFAESIEAIAKTPSGALIVLDFQRRDLAFYANADIPIAARVKNVEAFILCAATRIKYALALPPLAEKLQTIADRYLYDIKVLAIAPASEIEKIAEIGIDGVYALDNLLDNFAPDRGV